MSVFICPPDHGHGDNGTCYGAHRCRCDDCRAWNTGYHYRRRNLRALGREAPQGHVDATPTHRRVQALACLGWSIPQIGAFAGVAKLPYVMRRAMVRRSTAAAVAAAYEALSMRLPSPVTRHERGVVTKTKSRARAAGWVPPLGWDDIDDLAENPRARREEAA